MASYEALDRTERNAFIQLNSGVRCKRFAIVADDGIVTHVAVDNGTIDLDTTSVESILVRASPI